MIFEWRYQTAGTCMLIVVFFIFNIYMPLLGTLMSMLFPFAVKFPKRAPFV